MVKVEVAAIEHRCNGVKCRCNGVEERVLLWLQLPRKEYGRKVKRHGAARRLGLLQGQRWAAVAKE